MTRPPIFLLGASIRPRQRFGKRNLPPAMRNLAASASLHRHRSTDVPAVARDSRFQELIERSAVGDLPRLWSGASGGLGDARRIAAVVHLGIETVALLLEARHDGALERAAARQLHAHRVDEAAVDQNFVVD